jgi:hypothetical protein
VKPPLKVEGAAVFLSETDKLVLRARVENLRSLILTSNYTPFDEQSWLVVYGPDHNVGSRDKPSIAPTHTISLLVRLFSEGREIVSRKMEAVVPHAVGGGILYPSRVWLTRPSSNDNKFANHAMRANAKARLTGTLRDADGRLVRIDYRMGTLGAARYQIIRVEGLPRRLVVDKDGDGFRDYELVQHPTRHNGVLDQKLVYDRRIPLYPWTKDMLSA